MTTCRWHMRYCSGTDIDGNYNIPLTGYVGFWDERKEDEYKLYINGDNIAGETIDSDWLYENEYEYYNTSEAEWITVKQYSHDWNYDSNQIPEFPAISIPVVAILGLLCFFNYRKHKKEQDAKEKTQDLEVEK
ncbi:MAG: PEF-CTERM sorting domain-containing protein [Halobacteriota archaeon]